MVFWVYRRNDGAALIFVPEESEISFGILTDLENAHKISFFEREELNLSRYTKLGHAIYGILGLYTLEGEDFVVVIKSCESIGTVLNREVFQLGEVMFLSLKSGAFDDFTTSTNPGKEFMEYIASRHYYFSHSYDLTNRQQENVKGEIIWNNVKREYMWNGFMMSSLLEYRLNLSADLQSSLDESGIFVVAIQGFVDTKVIDLNFTMSLISRTNVDRIGTRFETRGVDYNGNVANFVESETIVESDTRIYSVVVIRGSIPVFWTQEGIQLKGHNIQLDAKSESENIQAMKKHLERVRESYRNIHIVDLVDQQTTSSEYALSQKYNHTLDAVGIPAKKTTWDFHAECPGGNFDNIENLTPIIERDVEDFGIFAFDRVTNTPISFQEGVFRVNCIDCLDRTNVIKAFITNTIMHKHLGESKSILESPFFISTFNVMWADNGDAISLHYAGTGAMKSDFTRTGVRTLSGKAQDFGKFLGRVVDNNLSRQSTQNVIDGLLGHLSGQVPVAIVDNAAIEIEKRLKLRENEFSSMSDFSIAAVTWRIEKITSLADLEVIKDIISFDDAQDLLFIATQYDSGDEIPLIWTIVDSFLSDSFPDIKYECKQFIKFERVSLLSLFCYKETVFVNGNQIDINLSSVEEGTSSSCLPIRFTFFENSFSFLNCYIDRSDPLNSVNSAIEKTQFKRKRTLSDHTHVLVAGDLNFRVDLQTTEAKSLLTKSADGYKTMLKHDKLIWAMENGQVLPGFVEAPITFYPTFKYNGNELTNYSFKFTPSWTDRICFTPNIENTFYNRKEITLSTHRPVLGLFKVSLSIYDEKRFAVIKEDIRRTVKKNHDINHTDFFPPKAHSVSSQRISSFSSAGSVSTQRTSASSTVRSSPSIQNSPRNPEHNEETLDSSRLSLVRKGQTVSSQTESSEPLNQTHGSGPKTEINDLKPEKESSNNSNMNSRSELSEEIESEESVRNTSLEHSSSVMNHSNFQIDAHTEDEHSNIEESDSAVPIYDWKTIPFTDLSNDFIKENAIEILRQVPFEEYENSDNASSLFSEIIDLDDFPKLVPSLTPQNFVKIPINAFKSLDCNLIKKIEPENFTLLSEELMTAFGSNIICFTSEQMKCLPSIPKSKDVYHPCKDLKTVHSLMDTERVGVYNEICSSMYGPHNSSSAWTVVGIILVICIPIAVISFILWKFFRMTRKSVLAYDT